MISLAVSIPQALIIQEVEDSRKETFGYETDKEWFNYVRQWSRQLKQNLSVEMKDE